MSGLLGLCATVSSTADRNYTDVCEEQSELRVIVLGSEMAVERYSVLIRDGLKRNISASSILSDLLLFCYLYIDIYVFSFVLFLLLLLCNCSL